MAHFAQINADGIVEQVLVVSNDVIKDGTKESEQAGIEFLQGLLGAETSWVQTSYNAAENGYRGKFAAIGDMWDGTTFTTPDNGIIPGPMPDGWNGDNA